MLEWEQAMREPGQVLHEGRFFNGLRMGSYGSLALDGEATVPQFYERSPPRQAYCVCQTGHIGSFI